MKSKVRLYFFLNGVPHKKLQVIHGQDILIAWNYIEEKTVSYIWSVARRNMEKAFLNSDVEKMFGKTRNSMFNYIKKGKIKAPYLTYSLDGQKALGLYLWNEDNIMDLHDMLLHNGPGRPRRDGKPIPSKIPSRAEVLAMMRNDAILYTKTSDGKYKPVWQANEW